MKELVDEMKAEKDIINPVQRFIRALKVQYDKIHLFQNNGAVNTEEIVDMILDTKGIAWRKALEGKEIVDVDEYNLIIDCCMESHLFQEGSLHLKLDETVFAQETEEGKQRIMQKCASLFGNIEKAHQVNLEVARDLRRLDSFDCRKLAIYMLSNGKNFLLLFCELFLQFHINLHLGCNAADFYNYSMTFYMKDKPKCVIPLIIPECFK